MNGLESIHWNQWNGNGFLVWQPLVPMEWRWFSMVCNHWSNDGMVTIHRCGLCCQQFDRNRILQRSNFILCLIMQVVNEYERAVIFRLGESYIRTYFQPKTAYSCPWHLFIYSVITSISIFNVEVA